MKLTECNRTLLIWTAILLAGSFCVVIPFALSPLVWIALLVAGAAAFYGAMNFNQKLPRVITKILWVVAAVLRWALLASVACVVLFVEYNDQSYASIFFSTLVPVSALCIVMLPSQALVACRSGADAARPAWTGLFHLVVAVFLYGFGVLMPEEKYVHTIIDRFFQTQGGIIAEIAIVLLLIVVAIAVPAVAFRGVLEQKKVSGKMPETEE